jgi:hypothetical protein
MADLTPQNGCAVPGAERSRALSSVARLLPGLAAQPIQCDQEEAVAEAIASGRWPDGFDMLMEHAATCPVCRDVMDVGVAIRADEASARHEARSHLPSPAIVWWRATVRARADASRTAERPISVAQGVAGACAVGLACGVAGTAWRSLDWFRRFGTVVAELEPSRHDLTAASALIVEHALPLVLGLGACLLIAPLALYLVLSDD